MTGTADAAREMLARENEILALKEENERMKRHICELTEDCRKHERMMMHLHNTIDRLQEAIVSQALMLTLALEYEPDGDAP